MKIYVKHTPSGFQWGTTPAGMTSLDVPITTTSQTPVTFQLLRLGPTAVFYRLQNGTSGKLGTADGPEQEVPVGASRTCSFAKTSSGSYESGTIGVGAFVK